jgi:hypothetical protein
METLYLILLSMLSLVCLVASFLLMRGLFPVRVDLIRQTLEEHWKRSFWIGLLNTVLITLVVAGLGSLAQGAPILYILVFGIYGIYLVGLLFGLAAFVSLLGLRLFPELQPVKRETRSGAIFVLASLLPGVGWFLLFPYAVSLAVGAVVITLLQHRRKRAAGEKEQ